VLKAKKREKYNVDIGTDLGSPVSLDYFDRRPFAFNGKINTVDVQLKPVTQEKGITSTNT
jgi:hypothetical protein